MRSPDERVVVTGLGMVTPFGIGHEAFWSGVMEARSAARLIDGLDPSRYPTPFACPVDDAAFDVGAFVANRKSVKLMSRANRFAMVAAHLAFADAALPPAQRDPLRSGVVHGAGGVGLHDQDYLDTMMAIAAELRDGHSGSTLLDLARAHLNPLTPLKMLPNIGAAHLAIEHDLRGENSTVCTACTSGTQAIGDAVRMIRHGRADVVLAGGSDAMINPMGLIAFGMLGVLSTRVSDPARAARPFDRDRDGFVMGEGSVLLVLESASHAARRGARVRAELAGYGGCSDAFRVTDEREDGSGCAEAMVRALDDAGLAPTDISYVNAHGTGTRMNDATEVRALARVFGDHLHRIAVSSTKSQVGHCVAAAGAVEIGACVLALEHQTMPPTINFTTPDPACDVDVVPNAARAARLDAILSNSFGFGGQNACVALKRWS